MKPGLEALKRTIIILSLLGVLLQAASDEPSQIRIADIVWLLIIGTINVIDIVRPHHLTIFEKGVRIVIMALTNFILIRMIEGVIPFELLEFVYCLLVMYVFIADVFYWKQFYTLTTEEDSKNENK